jgi:hypothetical protein
VLFGVQGFSLMWYDISSMYIAFESICDRLVGAKASDDGRIVFVIIIWKRKGKRRFVVHLHLILVLT